MSALPVGQLTYKQAVKEIEAILARVPDSEIPKPERIEKRPGETVTVAWWGGKGWHIEPGTTSPQGRRRGHFGLLDLFADEWLHRERERRYGKGYTFRDGKQIGGAA